MIKPATVQLPQSIELIYSIVSQNCKYISSCDLKSAFWSIPLTQASRPYTTFTSPDGLKFQYTVTPFGLSTSPAALQTVLLNVFSSKRPHLKLYMDDICVATETWSEHLLAIEQMLQTLEKNCLTANGAKCQFGFDEMCFLGFLISANGIRVDPKRIKIIEKLAPPKNKKSLQRLLGLFTYWRRFIQGFSVNTYHMRQLLLDDVAFHWSPQCQAELDFLKGCLIKDPILAPINPDKDLVIMCDAAGKTGIGFQTLQRGDDGLLHAIGYGGRALTKTQQNWHSSSLELAALAMAIKEFEDIAIHRNIFCLTDNAKVLALDKWTPQGQRERRLVTYLMQFNLRLRYVEGCKNHSADALSRCFDDMPIEDRNDFLPTSAEQKEDFILAINSEPTSNTESEILQLSDGQPGDYVTYTLIPTWQSNTDESHVQAVTTRKQAANKQNENNENSEPISDSPTEPETDEMTSDNATDSLPIQDADEPDLQIITENEGTDGNTQANITVPDDLSTEVLPTITAQDYLEDDELKNLYRLVAYNILTGNDNQDRQLLLMKERYFVEDAKLYKIALPRGKKLQRSYPVVERLCIPKKYRYLLLQHYHDRLGHYATERMFLTLFAIAYWENMYFDIRDYTQTCDICLRSKRNYKFKPKPLHCLEIPDGPFLHYQLDYKDLTRRTDEGAVAILCVVDAFSGYPIFIPVSDMSGETAGKVFIREIVTKRGQMLRVTTDRGSAFVNKFFMTIMKILGVQYRIASARSPRSNGLAEAMVKRLSELLKLYSQNDRKIHEVLPLCEFYLRATNHTSLKLSPFEIDCGRKMRTGLPLELSEKMPKLSGDQENYVAWLKQRLTDIHKAVSDNQVDNKREMKDKYDKYNRVVEPSWKIGDKVLIEENRIAPGSDTVLTHRKFKGPFLISDIVKGDQIGTAYRLVNMETGHPLKSLIGTDRLKAYTVDDREALSNRLPGVKISRVKKAEVQPPEPMPDGFEPAKKILKERSVNGQKQYLVLFYDRTSYWCDSVTNALLQAFRLRKAKRRRRR